jgi:putative glutamine amidotransferase
MQFINAQAGGTIYADVYAQKPGTLLHSAGRGGQEHLVHLEKDSRLRQIMGVETMPVNTYHIQALSDVGAGLKAVGFSPDGVIEAIESIDGRMVGVQFHPERMLESTKPLFEDFVARCRDSRK